MTPNQYRIGIVVAGVLAFMGGTAVWARDGLAAVIVHAVIALIFTWLLVQVLDEKPEQPADGSRW